MDYAEGVFLQEYLGPRKRVTSRWSTAATVSLGRIRNTNALTSATSALSAARRWAALLSAIEDKYGLARELLIRSARGLSGSKFNGPVQVTACKVRGKWRHRIQHPPGITSGSMILRLLANPARSALGPVRRRTPEPRWRDDVRFGCSLTLAGYGYPHLLGARAEFSGRGAWQFDCDVWWNEVERNP